MLLGAQKKHIASKKKAPRSGAFLDYLGVFLGCYALARAISRVSFRIKPWPFGASL